MVGVEVVRPGKEPAADLTTAVLAEARQRGLLVGRGGTAGNVLRVTPPLNVAEAKLETALEILAETFHTVQQSNNCH
jgi:4-aminobutyrate aminotransferase